MQVVTTFSTDLVSSLLFCVQLLLLFPELWGCHHNGVLFFVSNNLFWKRMNQFPKYVLFMSFCLHQQKGNCLLHLLLLYCTGIQHALICADANKLQAQACSSGSRGCSCCNSGCTNSKTERQPSTCTMPRSSRAAAGSDARDF